MKCSVVKKNNSQATKQIIFVHTYLFIHVGNIFGLRGAWRNGLPKRHRFIGPDFLLGARSYFVRQPFRNPGLHGVTRRVTPGYEKVITRRFLKGLGL